MASPTLPDLSWWAQLPDWVKSTTQLGALGAIITISMMIVGFFVGDARSSVALIPQIANSMSEHRKAERYALRTCIATHVLAKLNPEECDHDLPSSPSADRPVPTASNVQDGPGRAAH